MAKKKQWMGGTPAPIVPGAFEAAVTFARSRRFDQAIPLFQKAVQQNPKFTDGWMNLAEAQRAAGLVEEALDSYSQALMTSPGNVVILRRLAHFLTSHERWEEAVQVQEVLCTVLPSDPKVWLDHGNLLMRVGRLPEAEVAYRQAVHIDPDYTEAYQALAVVIHKRDDVEGQLWAIGEARRIDPTSVTHVCGHARSLQFWGRYEEALQVLDECGPALASTPEIRATKAMIVPHVAKDMAQIREASARCLEDLRSLRQEGVTVLDAHRDLPMTPFYIGYLGLDARELIEEMGLFFHECCPSLTSYHPNLERQPIKGRRPKVGFLSATLRVHSVGRVLNRVMQTLDPEQIETVHLQLPRLEAKEMNLGVRTIRLPDSLADQQKLIDREQCDVILNAEHVLIPATYFHAFTRFAPVQCATWGHPGTTGAPAMDHWLSWTRWEPEGNEAHYTENLVRLPKVPMILNPITLPEQWVARDAMGLPEHHRLYVCLQTLFKFHPQFDDLLLEILRRDELGMLVIITGEHKGWMERLRERWRKLDPRFESRVIALSHLPYDQYLSLLNTADVVLDTIHFSGGTSALDAFAVGAPVVTLPLKPMSSRMTAAFYEEIGFTDLVATSAQNYIDLAVRVAKDPYERERMVEEIRPRSEVLFDNLAPSVALTECLVNLASSKS